MNQPSEWAKRKILPLYRRRMIEQRGMHDGITRGHREFGFLPLDGHG